MFQFTRCLLPWLWIHQAVSRHDSGGVAPLGDSGIFAWMQLPLNVSPVSASVISRQRQGIHLVLCLACSQIVVSSSDRAPSPARRSRSSASLLLPIALSKIEVIMLLQLLVYVCSASRAVPAYYATLCTRCQHLFVAILWMREKLVNSRASIVSPAHYGRDGRKAHPLAQHVTLGRMGARPIPTILRRKYQ
jgi:hypothetical protein